MKFDLYAPEINVTNEDNMILMSRYPDKYFDLAIVDPPYGIGEGNKKNLTRNSYTGLEVVKIG